MTISSAPSGLLAADWVVEFTPRRPGETVGYCTVSRGGFSYSGSLNHDIDETVKAFWSEAYRAEAESIAAQPGIEAAQNEIRRAA